MDGLKSPLLGHSPDGIEAVEMMEHPSSAPVITGFAGVSSSSNPPSARGEAPPNTYVPQQVTSASQPSQIQQPLLAAQYQQQSQFLQAQHPQYQQPMQYAFQPHPQQYAPVPGQVVTPGQFVPVAGVPFVPQQASMPGHVQQFAPGQPTGPFPNGSFAVSGGSPQPMFASAASAGAPQTPAPQSSPALGNFDAIIGNPLPVCFPNVRDISAGDVIAHDMRQLADQARSSQRYDCLNCGLSALVAATLVGVCYILDKNYLVDQGMFAIIEDNGSVYIEPPGRFFLPSPYQRFVGAYPQLIRRDLPKSSEEIDSWWSKEQRIQSNFETMYHQAVSALQQEINLIHAKIASLQTGPIDGGHSGNAQESMVVSSMTVPVAPSLGSSPPSSGVAISKKQKKKDKKNKQQQNNNNDQHHQQQQSSQATFHQSKRAPTEHMSVLQNQLQMLQERLTDLQQNEAVEIAKFQRLNVAATIPVPVIRYLSFTAIRIEAGCFGLARNGAAIELLTSGVHVRTSPLFSFDQNDIFDINTFRRALVFRPPEDIIFGPLKMFIVRPNRARICFDNGKAVVFRQGRYAINSNMFDTLYGPTDDMPQAEPIELNLSIRTLFTSRHRVLLADGVSLAVTCVITFRITDPEKLVRTVGFREYERALTDVLEAQLTDEFAKLHLVQISAQMATTPTDPQSLSTLIPSEIEAAGAKAAAAAASHQVADAGELGAPQEINVGAATMVDTPTPELEQRSQLRSRICQQVIHDVKYFVDPWGPCFFPHLSPPQTTNAHDPFFAFLCGTGITVINMQMEEFAFADENFGHALEDLSLVVANSAFCW